MSEPTPLDLDRLAPLWRAEDAPVEAHRAVARRVRRHSLQMRLVTAAELVILVGLGLFTRWYLGDAPQAHHVVLVGAAWALALGSWALALWNRRGSWRPAAETAAAYLDLLERRARAKGGAARAVRALAGVQAAIVVALVAFAGPLEAGALERGNRLALTVGIAVAIAAGYVAWSVWYERRARAELADLRAARALLTDERDFPV